MTCPPTAQMKGCRKNWLFGHCGMSRPSCCSVANLCLTLCDPRTAALQASVSFTISKNLLKFMSIELVMLSNHLILCHLLLLPSSLPASGFFPMSQPLCIKWPKYWNFSISPSNECSGLISFRIDWFDLLAVQGTLKLASLTLEVNPDWSKPSLMM